MGWKVLDDVFTFTLLISASVQYLNVLMPLNAKREQCVKIDDFLTSSACDDDAVTRSHHLLEITLYPTQLLIVAGKTTAALSLMQVLLTSVNQYRCVCV